MVARAVYFLKIGGPLLSLLALPVMVISLGDHFLGFLKDFLLNILKFGILCLDCQFFFSKFGLRFLQGQLILQYQEIRTSGGLTEKRKIVSRM